MRATCGGADSPFSGKGPQWKHRANDGKHNAHLLELCGEEIGNLRVRAVVECFCQLGVTICAVVAPCEERLSHIQINVFNVLVGFDLLDFRQVSCGIRH